MYSADYSSAAQVTGVTFFIMLAFIALLFVAEWRIFSKAGEHGWACLVPIYNAYVMFKITWGNGWKFLLLLIPFVNVIISLVTVYKLGKVFGHGFGFFLLMLFFSPIALLILAFGSSQYQGAQ